MASRAGKPVIAPVRSDRRGGTIGGDADAVNDD
jgi:hypothetical protein